MTGERQVTADKLLGLRNLVAPTEQPFGALAACANVDQTDTGGLERRDGYTLAAALSGATDVFSPVQGEGLYVVAGGALTSYADDLTPTVLVTGLTDERFAWAEMDGRVAYAGASDAGLIVDRTRWQPLRIPVPASVAVTESAGTLPAGRYTVAVAYRHLASGVAGGASYAYHSLSGAAGLVVTVPAVSGYVAEVYVSAVDGEVPWYVGAALSAVECTSPPSPGLALDVAQRAALPLPEAPVALACYQGRLYAAVYDAATDTSVLFWSSAFYLQAFELGPNFLQVRGRILALHGAREALLIGTGDRLFGWDGETLVTLAAWGVVPGRPFASDATGQTVLWTTRGVCVFPDFTPLQTEKVAVAPGGWCTTAVVSRRGRRQCLVTTDGAGTPWNAYA